MLKKLAIASAMLATFAGAHAQSAPFGVTGVVTPGACTVTLTGGGIVDTGTVSQGTAKGYVASTGTTNTFYTFPNRTVPITIACSAATKVAVSFVDNKSAQKLAFDSNDNARYGIGDGAAGTAPIGTYVVSFVATTIDNVAVGQYMTAANGSATFSTAQPTASGYGPQVATPGRTIGFSKTAAATVPDALSNLAGTLQFTVLVSKPYIDAATSTVTPTGSGTLTLVYL